MRCASLPLLLLAPGMQAQQWVQLPDFPGTPRDDGAAFAINGNVYVGTGMEEGWELTNDWYMFDGSTLEWSEIAPLPATPRQYCSAFSHSLTSPEMGYLFGGLDADGPVNELWRYDATTDTWTQMASLPGEPRYAAVAFDNGYVATGSFADGTATNELWKYDRLTDTWQQLTSMPAPPRHRAAGILHEISGLHMVVGGADENFNALSDCWAYNSWTDTWSPCEPLPEGRYGALSGYAPTTPTIIGGATSTTTIVGSGYEYDGASFWYLVDPHPGGPRRGGIMINSVGPGAGFYHAYLGLGLSNDLVRHRDMYRATTVMGLSEQSMDVLAIYPNPTSSMLRPELPKHWPSAQCIIYDPLGRTVLEMHLQQGSSLDVQSLSAGRYELFLVHGDERLRASFIKLP